MDFRYAELCSFDPVQEMVCYNFKVVDPFTISLLKDQMSLVIEAKEDIEWISIDDGVVPCVIRAGCSKMFLVKNIASVKGSFRVLKDERRQIFQHEWACEG